MCIALEPFTAVRQRLEQVGAVTTTQRQFFIGNMYYLFLTVDHNYILDIDHIVAINANESIG